MMELRFSVHLGCIRWSDSIFIYIFYIYIFFWLEWISGLVDMNSASLCRKPEMFMGHSLGCGSSQKMFEVNEVRVGLAVFPVDVWQLGLGWFSKILQGNCLLLCLFCRESRISINSPRCRHADMGRCGCCSAGLVLFRALGATCGQTEHSLRAETLQQGAANSAKSLLCEHRAHNWIKIQGYFSWGQQRHILGSQALPLLNFKLSVNQL